MVDAFDELSVGELFRLLHLNLEAGLLHFLLGRHDPLVDVESGDVLVVQNLDEISFRFVTTLANETYLFEAVLCLGDLSLLGLEVALKQGRLVLEPVEVASQPDPLVLERLFPRAEVFTFFVERISQFAQTGNLVRVGILRVSGIVTRGEDLLQGFAPSVSLAVELGLLLAPVGLFGGDLRQDPLIGIDLLCNFKIVEGAL